MSSSTLPQASSTFWLIDATSVLDGATTTFIFTSWVPLGTSSTTAASSSTLPTHTVHTTRPSTNAVVGSVLGSAAVLMLALLFCFIYWKRSARPRLRLHRNNRRTLEATQSGNSSHALLDLAAGPTAHPSNIDPWVAPPAVRRTAKALPATIQELEMHGQQSTETVPAIESVNTSEASSHGPPVSPPAQVLQLVQHGQSVTLGSTSPSNRKGLPARRRQNRREPSPPRLEEDAGVSLMWAGEDTPRIDPPDQPPSYSFASGLT